MSLINRAVASNFEEMKSTTKATTISYSVTTTLPVKNDNLKAACNKGKLCLTLPSKDYGLGKQVKIRIIYNPSNSTLNGHSKNQKL